MLAKVNQLNNEIKQKKEERETYLHYFGTEIMMSIINYHVKNYEIESQLAKLKIKNDLLHTEEPIHKKKDIPLLEIHHNGKIYNLYLSKIKNKVCGEFYYLADFEKIMKFDKDFQDLIDLADSLIVQNSENIFNLLPKYIKKSNPEFRMIERSLIKKGLYYYRKHKNDSFGLIIM